MKDTLQINLSGMHPMDTMYTKDTRMNIISTCNYHRLFNSAHYRKCKRRANLHEIRDNKILCVNYSC